MDWFLYALIGVGALVVRSRVRAAQRRRQFKRYLPVMQGLVAEKRYQQALQVAELETEALVGVGRIADAVTQLAGHLSARFVTGQWPADKLQHWLTLYRRAGPIPVEAFYFCEVCGLHPETEALLQHAIDSGCEPPTGFPGRQGSAVVVHLSSPRKVED